MNTVFESENGYFALKGNGQFGNVTRMGWKPCRLGAAKKVTITKALHNCDTDKVYRRGNKIFRNLLNGLEEQI